MGGGVKEAFDWEFLTVVYIVAQTLEQRKRRQDLELFLKVFCKCF